ncbi:DNA replication/repair protein RecF [Bacillus thuringiensis]|uniref:DNA replication and repair protein RecF n=8 Tax=Bacillus cereus group TaxID=86661 RepID=RECF_BACC2|nr:MULTISPECIES: DNA replication/repair protein RecF [Bacillus]B7IS23.1 RecName: Full=DNA replication and repair protein RecF [Bacillus cereus G9842]EAO54004.1 DNA replication and repair protein recF [Bacillus thuringiensis serovar israelensis ATCC 35646]EEM38692.1 DNA replication and repair protein recF [Bacillus thuringiensis serovar sotto str. T04001]MED1155686.1 DNA replication/repair protein RecF [Bacillus paranthracis]ACK98413.1 DNA replication and repair protein RecF [Bacillus cereus G9
MFISEIQLKNYRNYEKLELSFEDKVNVIIGENAQGKTNLMEAIYVLAMAKSHRTSNDRELIRWDEEFGQIKGKLQKRNSSLSLELNISKKGKKAKLNQLEQQKLSQYIGVMNVVMFAPEDLNLVKGSPQVRRRFLDMELGQIAPIYLYELSQYQKVLTQRNHLLKKMQGNSKNEETMLDVFTLQLIEHGAKILQKRFEFLHLLQEWAAPIHRGISRGLEELEIVYKPSVDVSESMDLSKIKEVYYESFQSVKQREIFRGTTLIGPHRDDLQFFVNSKNVQVFGSQGQQRTTALSLKLAEIELIYSEVKEYPILLLDDVLSELDDYRQSHLLNTIQGKVQTFVTTTSVDGIEHETLKDAKTIHVTNGTVDCEIDRA